MDTQKHWRSVQRKETGATSMDAEDDIILGADCNIYQDKRILLGINNIGGDTTGSGTVTTYSAAIGQNLFSVNNGIVSGLYNDDGEPTTVYSNDTLFQIGSGTTGEGSKYYRTNAFTIKGTSYSESKSSSGGITQHASIKLPYTKKDYGNLPQYKRGYASTLDNGSNPGVCVPQLENLALPMVTAYWFRDSTFNSDVFYWANTTTSQYISGAFFDANYNCTYLTGDEAFYLSNMVSGHSFSSGVNIHVEHGNDQDGQDHHRRRWPLYLDECNSEPPTTQDVAEPIGWVVDKNCSTDINLCGKLESYPSIRQEKVQYDFLKLHDGNPSPGMQYKVSGLGAGVYYVSCTLCIVPTYFHTASSFSPDYFRLDISAYNSNLNDFGTNRSPGLTKIITHNKQLNGKPFYIETSGYISINSFGIANSGNEESPSPSEDQLNNFDGNLSPLVIKLSYYDPTIKDGDAPDKDENHLETATICGALNEPTDPTTAHNYDPGVFWKGSSLSIMQVSGWRPNHLIKNNYDTDSDSSFGFPIA